MIKHEGRGTQVKHVQGYLGTLLILSLCSSPYLVRFAVGVKNSVKIECLLIQRGLFCRTSYLLDMQLELELSV